MDDNRAQWIDQQLQRLATMPLIGYEHNGPQAAEPIACSAICAAAYGQHDSAEVACRRLFEAQNRDGSVAVLMNEQGPYWTTSLACLAWRWFEIKSPKQAKPWCLDGYCKGIDYLVSCGGEPIARGDTFGHNSQLIGWPWVDGTHSWIEPTALALLALRHCGFGKHPRAIEAASLLLDRQLPSGGANYGNTFVLGKQLRPHVLPSAMSLIALHQWQKPPQRMVATANYLRGELNRPLGAVSLSWLVQALAADDVGSVNPTAEVNATATKTVTLEYDWALRQAIHRSNRAGANPHRQNMLMLAMLGADSPLLDYL